MICYIDIETTGFDPKTDRITRLSAIRTHGYQILDILDQMVNPCRSIPPKISRLTGLTSEFLGQFPTLQEVRDDFLNFTHGCTLIAYGDFENRWLPHHGLAAKCFSALPAVRRASKEAANPIHGVPDHRLVTIAKKLRLPHDPHNSLSDVLVLYNACNMLRLNIV